MLVKILFSSRNRFEILRPIDSLDDSSVGEMHSVPDPAQTATKSTLPIFVRVVDDFFFWFLYNINDIYWCQ